MKKVTGFGIMALGLTAGLLLAACGGKSDETGTQAAAGTTAAASSAAETASDPEKAAEASAGGGTGADRTAAEGITFTYIRDASTTSFDLHTEVTANNAFAIDKVFEPLVMFDSDGNIYDFLAESHEISDDGTVYTFKLRDGLKFSDGSDVTAEDVRFSLERHIEVGGSLPIQADVVKVEAADEDTVVITLSQAYTPFISELASFANGIIPADFGGKSEEEFFKNPIGTGPFAVSDWNPAGDLVFVRNEYYWQGVPTVEKLIYRIVDDENQAVSQLRTGEADAIESGVLSYAVLSELDEDGDINVLSGNGWTVEEVFFNTLDEHFADVHVRRALALAIDREAITASQTYGYGVTANTVLPAALRYNTNDTVEDLAYDVDAARAELALSAYPDGFETSINIASGNNARLQEAQIIQAAGQSIGIDITINQQETAVFREDFKALNFSIMINSAVADYPDADSIFAFQVDPEGFSQCYWTSYKNDEAIELLHKGQTVPDGDDRAEVYASLQQLLADEVPYIPLYYPENAFAVKSGIDGLEILPNGSAVFNNIAIG